MSADRRVRLTTKQVTEIRRRYAKERISMVQLAAKFGVAKSTIQDIIEERTWKHVARPVPKATHRRPELLRTLRVLRELTAAPSTLDEISERLGMAQSAVYRDIALLTAVGIEIRYAAGRYLADHESVRAAVGLATKNLAQFRIR